MKKILSLILAFIFAFSQNAVFAQGGQISFSSQLYLYDIFPDTFVEKIETYLNQAEQFIMAQPTASEAEIARNWAGLKAQDEHIFQVLKAKKGDTEFIERINSALQKRSFNKYTANPFLRYYTEETIKAVSLGKRPAFAVSYLKHQPQFFTNAALKMLEESTADFRVLTQRIQKELGVPRERAVSLALSTEAEYSRKVLGGEIAKLREDIALRKFYIRNAGARSEKQIAAWRKEIKAAQTRILTLKKARGSDSQAIAHIFGPKEISRIAETVKLTDAAAKPLIKAVSAKAGRKAVKVSASGLKSLKAALPAAISAGLFMMAFAVNADASPRISAQTENAIINAVSDKANLKREILKTANESPSDLGLIYLGGPQIQSLIAELFEKEGKNAVSAEKILPYIEDWAERIKNFSKGGDAAKEYFAVLKAANLDLNKKIDLEFKNKIEQDLKQPADNTRVEKFFPAVQSQTIIKKQNG